jgi:hypothetical protein
MVCSLMILGCWGLTASLMLAVTYIHYKESELLEGIQGGCLLKVVRVSVLKGG